MLLCAMFGSPDQANKIYTVDMGEVILYYNTQQSYMRYCYYPFLLS